MSPKTTERVSAVSRTQPPTVRNHSRRRTRDTTSRSPGENDDGAESANRVANAVANVSGGAGINTKCITVMGTTIHGTYAQYRYLDHPSRDLSSVAKQAYATRHASARVMQQRGLGFYFVGASDLEPLSGAPYTRDQLIARMVLEAKRARRP